MEKLPLFGGKAASVWSTAESDVVAETNRVKSPSAAMRWHIAVDHYGGEAKYPIGWPRLWRALKGAERDWSGYDFLEFRVFADTTRDKLPGSPVTLLLRTDAAEGSWARALTELKKGEWVNFSIPIAGLPKPDAVQQIMFSISDSNYRHKDEVEFSIADLALTRWARPTLVEFAPERAVLFADAGGLPVRFRLSGLKAGERAEIVCELKRAGETVGRAVLATERGSQRLVLKPSARPWHAGAYELVGKIGDGPPRTTSVRLVESPWTEKGAKP